MKRPRALWFPLYGLSLVLLAGCATSPISKDLRQQARPLTLGQVNTNPGHYTGTVVIWGGTILQTVNDTNGASIYILKLPLDCDQRPRPYEFPGGRFIAHRATFIDPEVFHKGRLITVAGTLAGARTEPFQKTHYTYPVVNIEQLHLWHPRPFSYYYPSWYWGWGGAPLGWDWGWYAPNWGWGWYGPGWDGWHWDYPW